MFEKIKDIIAEQAGVDSNELTSETCLKDDLNLDSLNAVEIIMALEDEFDIEISEDEAENFETIGDIYEFINNLKKKGCTS